MYQYTLIDSLYRKKLIIFKWTSEYKCNEILKSDLNHICNQDSYMELGNVHNEL